MGMDASWLTKRADLQAEMAETRVEKYDDIFKGNEDVKYGKFSKEWEFQLGG